MSLSNIYSNSHGFQADESIDIDAAGKQWKEVKYPAPKKTGFARDEIKSVNKPPQDEKPTSVSQKIETAPKETIDPKSDSKEDKEKPSPQEIKQQPVKEKTVSIPENVIPDNYIDIQEAKKSEDAAYQRGLSEARKNIEETKALSYSEGFDTGLAQGKTEAHDEAFNAGKEEAKKSIETDFDTASRSLLNICQQLETYRDKILTDHSASIQNFAIEITEKLIQLSIQKNEKIIIATLHEALARALKPTEIEIYLHPDDYDVVEAHKPEIISVVAGLENIILKRDSKLAPGGAYIESDKCVIDATISNQLETIYQELGLNEGK
ncbi:MAG: FliH/SctL family protein [Desulfotalea sp.]